MNRTITRSYETFSRYYNKYKYIRQYVLAGLVVGLLLSIMIVLITSSMASSNCRKLRCTSRDNDESNTYNKTVYLVHDGRWTQNQLDILKRIKTDYQDFHIQLDLITYDETNTSISPESQNHQLTPSTTAPTTAITSGTASTAKLKLLKPIETFYKKMKYNIDNNQLQEEKPETIPYESYEHNNELPFSWKRLIYNLIQDHVEQKEIREFENSLDDANNFDLTTVDSETMESFTDILEYFPNLSVRYVKLANLFKDSPLKQVWHRFDPSLVYFSIRVLYLWEHGGLSFILDDDIDANLDNNRKKQEVDNLLIASDKIDDIPSHAAAAKELIDFIATGSLVFQSLPKEILTADKEGLHIFVKTPCHLFLEEIIMNLRHAVKGDTPQMIIEKCLNTFCRKWGRKNDCKSTVIRSIS